MRVRITGLTDNHFMNPSKILTSSVLVLISIIIGACTPDLSPPTEFSPKDSPPASISTTSMSPPTPMSTHQAKSTSQKISMSKLGFTYQQPNGNRVIPGAGISQSPTPIDIQLPGIPNWVVGVPFEEGIIWTVALEDGSLISMFSSKQGISDYPNPITNLAPGAPVHSMISNNQHSVITVADSNQSHLTHPIYLPKTNSRAYITQNGELNIIDTTNQLLASLPVDALPDARMLIDDQDRILLLTNPTERYNHGVLGDGLEAGSITLVDTNPQIQIAAIISINNNEVIEGIAPIWGDLTGDGKREILVTVSDREMGAGIVIFSESGQLIARGAKMGQPFRWRHQIAYGPTGPDGKDEIVVVRTPHIGGVIEYYQIANGEIEVVAEYSGITSHKIGSRNLDMAAVADLDGDGAIEVLLPSPDLEQLVAIRRIDPGAEEILRLPFGGQLSTNIAGVTLPNGQMAIGVGKSDGVLRIWMPEN